MISIQNLRVEFGSQVLLDGISFVVNKRERIALVSRRVTPEVPLMTTRYCLLRELGLCLCTPRGRAVAPPLYLRHGDTLIRVDCLCDRCEMQLHLNSV